MAEVNSAEGGNKLRRSLLPVAALLCASSHVLLAQTPPIKMGLWEKKMTTTRETGAPVTLTSKSCVTAEEWERMMANSAKPHKNCTVNKSTTAHGYSFNSTCTMQGGASLSITGSTTIQDPEHITGEMHSTMTRNGQKQEMQSQSTSRFLSSDCGSIKPGDPEVEDK